MYVGIIYIIKGVEELSINFYDERISNGFASAMVAILFTLTVYLLEKLGQSTIFRPGIRAILGDYAYPIATILWTGFTHIPGNLSFANFARLPITRAFYPTVDRSWLIDFWNLPIKWVFVALPFGLLLTLLFYYDHNVSSLTAQAKQFPLKKPAGFHWDFFLLGITSFVSGIIGIPLPNGLVPQAPVHTDSLTNYEDQVETVTTTDGHELRRKKTVAVSVVEQRLSHFLMALAITGTMTGPLLIVLHTMPRAVFSGVFFIVGWGSIETNGIVHKLLFLLQEPRFIQPSEPLLKLPKPRITLYISIQLIAVAATVAISQTVAAIAFPILIVSLIPLRWIYLPKIFKDPELRILDDLTADNPAVLVSLGGRPQPRSRSRTGTPRQEQNTSQSLPRPNSALRESHTPSDLESDSHTAPPPPLTDEEKALTPTNHTTQ
ncbi:putative hco3transporter family protein [Phaeomoniella chlamydospora]|uniref:Putative hco3transporter family protein n=1 Tax=Phaeomoniella chlamydospora TaxID=158046 RepID=A0A0G2GIV1_PHACM|nr:putative hco3transporter family protein [Phaeomoniella chlamydospora]